MLSIQRLNMDNTWWVNWGGTSLLLDPWLIGSEVDGFSWFNEQWHANTTRSFNGVTLLSIHCCFSTLLRPLPRQNNCTT
jgi:L-ascorbate metabolism protein UlaG (beta-lactamase superfamily)